MAPKGSKKDPNAPKNARSAYILYKMQLNRAGELDGYDAAEQSVEASRRWKEISEKEKQAIKDDLGEKDKEYAKIEMDEFKREFFWEFILLSEFLEKGSFTPHPDRLVAKTPSVRIGSLSVIGNKKHTCPICLFDSPNFLRHVDRSHYPGAKSNLGIRKIASSFKDDVIG